MENSQPAYAPGDSGGPGIPGIPGNQQAPELTRFETGAVRSTDASDVRFDLIPPKFLINLARAFAEDSKDSSFVPPIRIDLIPLEFLVGLARLYAEGQEKYGEYNWQKGIPVEDLLNHGLRHVVLWMAGDRSEDHLLHAVWNFLTAWLFLDRPELLGRFAVDGDGDGKGDEKGKGGI